MRPLLYAMLEGSTGDSSTPTISSCPHTIVSMCSTCGLARYVTSDDSTADFSTPTASL